MATQKYINDQWYSWLEALQLIPGVTWINHPQINDAMENKVRQLLLASELGFHIPRTLITNDPEHARRFVQAQRAQAVAKALYSPLIEELDQDYFVFANEVTLDDLEADDEIKLSPVVFQQALSPKVDYRVTVVGQTVFAARIERARRERVHIDWRTDKDNVRFVRCQLPVEVEKLCREYVLKNGLLFGAIDIVKQNEDFIFLEINPNGEWGWLQRPNNFPIAQSLCDLMILQDQKAID